MCGMFPFMMLTLKSLTYKYCRKHGENEGLQKGHQHFYEINENRKRYRNQRAAPTSGRMDLAENEDQRDQTDDDDVTGYHVRKKTNDKGHRLDEHAQEFHRNEDELDS